MQPRLAFPHREDFYGFDVFRPALGVGVEIAHGVQLVPEELRPDRLLRGRGEDVQNSTPEGELTRPFHHAASTVACGGKPRQKLLYGILPTSAQGEHGLFQNLRGHGAQGQGFPGENLHRSFARQKVIELPQPLLLPLPGNHGGII